MEPWLKACHTHDTNNKHVEPPRLKPPWSCDTPQDKIQLVLSQRVVAAAVTVGNGRRRGGVIDVVAALKCVDRLSQLCIHQHAAELRALMSHCH